GIRDFHVTGVQTCALPICLVRYFGGEPRIFDPSDLPLPDQVKSDDHPAVHELRQLAMWSEGQIWCSPERHGQITSVMKAQIDHQIGRASCREREWSSVEAA